MENPTDITTTPVEALMRRLTALEQKLSGLETGRISRVSYFSGTEVQVNAKLAELAGAAPGTMIALLTDKGVEGVFTNIAVLFPAPYGWVKF